MLERENPGERRIDLSVTSPHRGWQTISVPPNAPFRARLPKFLPRRRENDLRDVHAADLAKEHRLHWQPSCWDTADAPQRSREGQTRNRANLRTRTPSGAGQLGHHHSITKEVEKAWRIASFGRNLTEDRSYGKYRLRDPQLAMVPQALIPQSPKDLNNR